MCWATWFCPSKSRLETGHMGGPLGSITVRMQRGLWCGEPLVTDHDTECHQVGGGIPLKDKETRVPRGQCFCWRQCLMFQWQSQNPSLVLQFPGATGYTALSVPSPVPERCVLPVCNDRATTGSLSYQLPHPLPKKSCSQGVPK